MSKPSTSSSTSLLVFILTLGVFGILNTEMGVVGILPLIAETFQVSISDAGWTVSVFALVVAFSGPILPLLFSGMNRKAVMLLSLGIFIISNIISMVTTSFAVLLAARAIPAFFHPVYVSMAFTVAASSVSKKDAPKAVAKVFIGVSAGMVLGVPVSSFIASETSFSMAMLFFTVINAVVFLATLFFVPSMPVKERLSYGSQLKVLKKAITWHSLIAVTFINGAVFGLFSFLSDYLKNITGFSFKTISIALFVYGVANIIGNVIAGKLLSKAAAKTVKAIPFALAAGYVLFFALGEQGAAMLLIILGLGILAGMASNNNQYMLTNAAPEAPDFANGLFLTSTNLGTAVGTALCGLFISSMGTRYVVIGTLLFLLVGTIFVFLRYRSSVKLPVMVRIVPIFLLLSAFTTSNGFAQYEEKPVPPLETRIAPELLGTYNNLPPLDLTKHGPDKLRNDFTGLVGSDGLPKDQAVTVYNTIIPGKNSGEKIRLRIYKPIGLEKNAPGIYWIHGGGFLFGVPEQDEAQSLRWAKEVGAVVVAVDYRLAPEHPYPAPLEDCYAGLVWFSQQAEAVGVDKHRIAVAGASAGGNLTAAVALMARDLDGPPLAFQMPLYPMIEDRFITPASREYFGNKVWNNTDNLYAWRAYLGNLAGTDAVSPYMAPARATDLSGLPPAYS